MLRVAAQLRKPKATYLSGTRLAAAGKVDSLRVESSPSDSVHPSPKPHKSPKLGAVTPRQIPAATPWPSLTHIKRRFVMSLECICVLMILAGCKSSPTGKETRIGVETAVEDADVRLAGNDAAAADGSLPPRPETLRLPPTKDALVVPFGGSAALRIDITANLERLDVLFLVDTTASMGGEIEQLQTTLSSDIIPPLRARIPDVAFGVARFEDFPLLPHGAQGKTSDTARADEPFNLLSPITLDEKAVLRALRELDNPLGWGGDGAESGYEALYQAASGEGFKYKSKTYIQPFVAQNDGAGELGGAGFRQRAMPSIVHITDAPSHMPDDYLDLDGVHGFEEAKQALQDLGARVVGVASGKYAFGEQTAMALATGALIPASRNEVCESGAPSVQAESSGGYGCALVYRINEDGSDLSDSVVSSLASLVENLNFAEVRAVVGADPNGLIQSILPLAPATGAPSAKHAVDLRPLAAPDGIPDTYLEVNTGTTLSFEVTIHNDHIAPSLTEQSFRVLIQVLGDGWTLEQHYVRVVVPPWPFDSGVVDPDTMDADAYDPDMPDAGVHDGGVLGDAGTNANTPDASPASNAPADAPVRDGELQD